MSIFNRNLCPHACGIVPEKEQETRLKHIKSIKDLRGGGDDEGHLEPTQGSSVRKEGCWGV